jgi:thiol-disulfide isomerase/thioredoxin
MTLTPSKMMPLGTRASAFTLYDPIAKTKHTLYELQSDSATVIAFICNHCPYVQHIRSTFVAVAKQYQAKGISFIAINANPLCQDSCRLY